MKSFEKTADFECQGEPESYPWFQGKGKLINYES